jgi:hypothetical protein
MWKSRIGALAAAGVTALGTTPAAWAATPAKGTGNSNSKPTGNSKATGKAKPKSTPKSSSKGKSNHSGTGDSNAGDVWVGNVGQPSGPGHEMDPHLACSDIALWGSGMADTSDTFTIVGWPPSGKKKTDYSGTWKYAHTSGRKSGTQMIAQISVSQLISNAQANGDTPTKQGYHFKLNLVQDPQKHKTFWVDCTSVPGSSGTGTSTGSSPSSRGVHGSHKRRHKLVAPARHHKAAKRSVEGVGETSPAFTG